MLLQKYLVNQLYNKAVIKPQNLTPGEYIVTLLHRNHFANNDQEPNIVFAALHFAFRIGNNYLATNISVSTSFLQLLLSSNGGATWNWACPIWDDFHLKVWIAALWRNRGRITITVLYGQYSWWYCSTHVAWYLPYEDRGMCSSVTESGWSCVECRAQAVYDFSGQ